jgi:type IV pilus assembly protein PilA
MTTLNSRLQLALLNRKKARNVLQKGFTLVELMIVIVIVGILSGVALPNFLGTRDKAEAQAFVGAMSGFAKLCSSNMVMGDAVDLGNVPTEIAMDGTAGGAGVPCDGGANVLFTNATAFAQPTRIGGVRCGLAEANGVDESTCTLTVDSTTGTVTGAWS